MTDPLPPTTGSDNEATSSDNDSAPDNEREDAESLDNAAAPTPTKRSLMRRLGRYALVLGLLAGLAAAIVYVAPIINDRILRPVETNTADTAALQTSLEDADTRIGLLEAEAAALRSDLEAVGSDVASVDEAVTANAARLDDLDTLVADQTTRLDELDELAATLRTEIEFEASSTALEIEFLKSTELLSRARLFLYQANYGLAEQDVQGARDLLITLLEAQSDDGPVDTIILASALSRIDLVLAALPDRPVAASDDLDIAWRLLLDEPLSPLVASTNPAAPVPGETPPTTLQD